MPQVEEDNLSAKRAWNRNAEFWNERMADGNDFFKVLLWPAVETLLHPEASAYWTWHAATADLPEADTFRGQRHRF
jgi:hypothetical protein